MIDSMAHDLTQTPPTSRRGKPGAAAAGARQRAFVRARRHSLMVRVLKVGLPVAAVVTTGALFVSPTMLLRVASPGLNATVGAVQITTDQLRMINPRYDGFTADKGHYVVTAKAAVQMLDNTDLMRLETVHGHIDQVDQSWTDLTSKAGTFQIKSKAMQLTGGIVITTSTQARVELDHADMDVDKKLVTSDAPVTMTMPNGTLKGRGLLVDNAARRVLLRSAVVAHLLPPKRPDAPAATPAAPGPGGLPVTPAMSDAPVDITSKQLEVLDNAKTATFSGAVQAVQAGMTVRSDRMEVGYAGAPGAPAAAASQPSVQNLNHVTNLDHVVITTPDGRMATCDQSRFDQKANTMTLLGSVVLSQKSSELHADSVVYDMQAKRTHVSARNRISGHFEPDGSGAGAADAGAALGGLGASRTATDISADSLEIANADNEAVFRGTVIVTQRGNKLTGDRLTVDMVRHHMLMNGPGRVSGTFEATAAQAPGGNTAKVAATGDESAAPGLGHSFTSLSASNGQPTNIEADSLKVEDDRGQAVFSGKVVVVRGGHRIASDQLTVDYGKAGGASQEGGQLKQINAKGHVVVRTPDNQAASSDWLIFDSARNLVTMGGNVTVAQGSNVIHGEKLLVDLTTGESHFETRSQETIASEPGVTASSGRIQVLITPQGIRQIGGPPVKGAPPEVQARQKQDISASDVLVGPADGSQPAAAGTTQ